jgi:hypothetical protein
LGLTQHRRVIQEVLGLLGKGGHGLAKPQELLFRVAHQFDKDLALATTLAAKAPHDFAQLLVERLGLPREARDAPAARLRDVGDGPACAFEQKPTVWL